MEVTQYDVEKNEYVIWSTYLASKIYCRPSSSSFSEIEKIFRLSSNQSLNIGFSYRCLRNQPVWIGNNFSFGHTRLASRNQGNRVIQ